MITRCPLVLLSGNGDATAKKNLIDKLSRPSPTQSHSSSFKSNIPKFSSSPENCGKNGCMQQAYDECPLVTSKTELSAQGQLTGVLPVTNGVVSIQSGKGADGGALQITSIRSCVGEGSHLDCDASPRPGENGTNLDQDYH